MSPGLCFGDEQLAEPLPMMAGLPSEDGASTSSKMPADARCQQARNMSGQQSDMPYDKPARAAPGQHSRAAADSRTVHQYPSRQQMPVTAAPDPRQQQLVSQQQRSHKKQRKHGQKEQQQQQHEQHQHSSPGLHQSGELQHQVEELHGDANAPRSITTPHTIEMARVLSSLCGSSNSSERLTALGKVNGLRGILGNGAVKLRLQHLKVGRLCIAPAR